MTDGSEPATARSEATAAGKAVLTIVDQWLTELETKLSMHLAALEAKLDASQAKVDFVFDKYIGEHFRWKIDDNNKVVLLGMRPWGAFGSP